MGAGTVISSLLAIVFSIALVLALAWGALWLLKKWQDRTMGAQGAGTGDRGMRFVRALPLGPRERVVLVETGGEILMLGVTAASITVLSRWNEEGEALGLDAQPAIVPPPVLPAASGRTGLAPPWR